MVEYFVIVQNTIHIFERAVNDAIAEGWEPLGGIMHDDGVFYQAMIRRPQHRPPTIPFPHPVRSSR